MFHPSLCVLITSSCLLGAEVELLRLVETRPGIGVSDAAKELYLAGNSVSTLVNRLVRDGCLVRATHPADRRAALVGPHVARLDAADRHALHAALPALRALAVTLHEEA
jgi:DNA-binding MarR family transcriptional regulator